VSRHARAAIETRGDDEETQRLLAPLEDCAARVETTAERSLLAALGGGCQVPIGGSARLTGDRLRLTAMVASPDGAQLIRVSHEGSASDAIELGRRAAEDLLGRGADRIRLVYAP
jgi:hydroxymethylbilane synthase